MEPIVEYSLVEGGYPGIGNKDEDPIYIDPLGADGIAGTDDDDLRLDPASPGVDAGENGALDECEVDRDGNERFVDGPPDPEAAIVDMGAYELGGLPADCNRNGFDDLTCDLGPGGSEDCNDNGVPDECDIDEGTSEDQDGDGVPDECQDCPGDITGDGVVDVADLVALLLSWGPCDEPCPADLNLDGGVDAVDLQLLIVSVWGPC
jgi:hypothetical protein